MNFVEQLIENGFKRVVHSWSKDQIFNTNNGWMGLTINHPYEKFVRGNALVELSLERYNVSDLFITKDRTTKISVSEKLIKCSIDGEVIYENKYGVIPPKEIQQKIINA